MSLLRVSVIKQQNSTHLEVPVVIWLVTFELVRREIFTHLVMNASHTLNVRVNHNDYIGSRASARVLLT